MVAALSSSSPGARLAKRTCCQKTAVSSVGVPVFPEPSIRRCQRCRWFNHAADVGGGILVISGRRAELVLIPVDEHGMLRKSLAKFFILALLMSSCPFRDAAQQQADDDQHDGDFHQG